MRHVGRCAPHPRRLSSPKPGAQAGPRPAVPGEARSGFLELHGQLRGHSGFGCLCSQSLTKQTKRIKAAGSVFVDGAPGDCSVVTGPPYGRDGCWHVPYSFVPPGWSGLHLYGRFLQAVGNLWGRSQPHASGNQSPLATVGPDSKGTASRPRHRAGERLPLDLPVPPDLHRPLTSPRPGRPAWL